MNKIVWSNGTYRVRAIRPLMILPVHVEQKRHWQLVDQEEKVLASISVRQENGGYVNAYALKMNQHVPMAERPAVLEALLQGLVETLLPLTGNKRLQFSMDVLNYYRTFQTTETILGLPLEDYVVDYAIKSSEVEMNDSNRLLIREILLDDVKEVLFNNMPKLHKNKNDELVMVGRFSRNGKKVSILVTYREIGNTNDISHFELAKELGLAPDDKHDNYWEVADISGDNSSYQFIVVPRFTEKGVNLSKRSKRKEYLKINRLLVGLVSEKNRRILVSLEEDLLNENDLLQLENKERFDSSFVHVRDLLEIDNAMTARASEEGTSASDKEWHDAMRLIKKAGVQRDPDTLSGKINDIVTNISQEKYLQPTEVLEPLKTLMDDEIDPHFDGWYDLLYVLFYDQSASPNMIRYFSMFRPYFLAIAQSDLPESWRMSLHITAMLSAHLKDFLIDHDNISKSDDFVDAKMLNDHLLVLVEQVLQWEQEGKSVPEEVLLVIASALDIHNFTVSIENEQLNNFDYYYDELKQGLVVLNLQYDGGVVRLFKQIELNIQEDDGVVRWTREKGYVAPWRMLTVINGYEYDVYSVKYRWLSRVIDSPEADMPIPIARLGVPRDTMLMWGIYDEAYEGRLEHGGRYFFPEGLLSGWYDLSINRRTYRSTASHGARYREALAVLIKDVDESMTASRSAINANMNMGQYGGVDNAQQTSLLPAINAIPDEESYGGVDFRPAGLNVQVDADGAMPAIEFDEAMMASWGERLMGFDPVVINVMPTTARVFLGLGR